MLNEKLARKKGQLLYDSTYEVLSTGKLIEIENKIEVTRGQQGVIVYKVSVRDDGKVIGVDGGDGCRRKWMSLMPQN